MGFRRISGGQVYRERCQNGREGQKGRGFIAVSAGGWLTSTGAVCLQPDSDAFLLATAYVLHITTLFKVPKYTQVFLQS